MKGDKGPRGMGGPDTSNPMEGGVGVGAGSSGLGGGGGSDDEGGESEGYTGPSLGSSDNKTRDARSFVSRRGSGQRGGGFGAPPEEEKKSGFAGFMDTITGGDKAEARRLGMTTQEYKDAKKDAGPGTGVFGQTQQDIASAHSARKRDAATAKDLGIGVEQFRAEMAAEAEAGPEAKGIRETRALEKEIAAGVRRLQASQGGVRLGSGQGGSVNGKATEGYTGPSLGLGDDKTADAAGFVESGQHRGFVPSQHRGFVPSRGRWEAHQEQQKAEEAAGSKMMADWESSVREKQAEMDLARGAIKADEYEAVAGKPAPPQLVEKGLRAAKGLARGMVERAVTPGGIPDVEGAAEKAKSYDLADTAMDVGLGLAGPLGWAAKATGLDEKIKSGVKVVTDPITGALRSVTDPVVDAISGAISPITKPITGALKSGKEAVMGATDKALGIEKGPVSFQEAIEARAEEKKMDAVPKHAPRRGGGGGPSPAPTPPPVVPKAAPAPAPAPAAAAAAPAPDAAPGKVDVQGERAGLVEDLKKQASGEDSLAEKQIKRTQDRSLAQRLAAMKSMRGKDAGSKLRSFSRASDKARREAEGQIEIAGMKERRSAQDQLRSQLNTMSQEEATERWRKISRDDKQRLLKMDREDAIKKGEYQKWLTVAAMGQKFFKDEIKDAGDWVNTNVLDPIKEGGKKLIKKGGDFIKDTFGWDEGGFVSGPGSETSDSIPARLSDGEFVIKSSAVRGLGKVMGGKGKKGQREKGVDFLYKLQDKMDKAEKFSEGGEFVDPDSFVRSFNREIEKRADAIKRKTKKLAGRKSYDDGGEVQDPYRYEQRFISTLSPKQRREIADEELDEIGFRRIKEAREKSGNEGFQAARVTPDEHERIETKYGVFDELSDEEKASEERQNQMFREGEYAKGGEAYVRPKKAFREAIGYEPESRFHDKALKDAKFGGARRKFRHFQQGGPVSLGVKSLKPQFNVPQAQGYGSVVAAQKDLDRRIAELERQLGR